MTYRSTHTGSQIDAAVSKVDSKDVVVKFANIEGNVSDNAALNSAFLKPSDKGVADGVASLDANGKVPTTQINDALLGNVKYQGLWNAETNTPELGSAPTADQQGYYWIVSVAGTQFETSFEVGDWIIAGSSAWQKVDNTDAVSSVEGRTGNVTVISDSAGSGSTTYTWSANKLNTEFSKKQGELSPVAPVKIERITESAVHNGVSDGTYTVPLQNVSNLYIAANPGWYSTNLYFQYGNGSQITTVPTDFNSWCEACSEVISWIDIPVDFSSLNMGDSATATINFTNGAVHGISYALCDVENNLIMAIQTGINKNVNDPNLFVAIPGAVSSTSAGKVTYAVAGGDYGSWDYQHKDTPDPSLSGCYTKLIFTNNGTTLRIHASIFATIWSTSEAEPYHVDSLPIPEGFSSIRKIRVFYYSGDQECKFINAGTSYSSGWTLANSTNTYDALYLDYDNNTLKKNSQGELYADVAIDVDSALSTSSVNPVQNKVITKELNKKQDAFDTVYPLQLTTQTIGAPHNYTISGTTATAQYAPRYFQEHYVGSNSGYVYFNGNSFSGIPTSFDELWDYNLSYIEIPVNYKKLIEDLEDGEISSFSTTVAIADMPTRSNGDVWVLGEKLNGSFNPIIYITASVYNYSLRKCYMCNPDNIVGYANNSIHYEEINYDNYETANWNLGAGTNTAKLVFSCASTDTMYDIGARCTNTSSGWGTAIKPKKSQAALVKRINCVRYFSGEGTAEGTNTPPVIDTTKVTYDGTGWTLADGIETSYNMNLLYDNDTIKKNANNELYADVGITVDSALSGTSTNPVQNKVVKEALDNKQDLLTPIAPVVINTETISPTDNVSWAGNIVTLSGNTCSTTGGSETNSMKLLGSSNTAPPTSVENCLSRVADIRIPVVPFDIGSAGGISVKLGGLKSSGSAMQGYIYKRFVILFGKNTGSDFIPRFAMSEYWNCALPNAGSAVDDTSRAAWDFSTAITPSGSMVESSESVESTESSYEVSLSYTPGSAIKLQGVHIVGSTNPTTSKTTRYVNIPNSAYSLLSDINEIRVLRADYSTSETISLDASKTVRNDGDWNLADASSTTINQLKVKYDNDTIKKNANNELFVEVDSTLSTTSTNPVQNRIVNLALEEKQDAFDTVYPLQLATQTTGAPHNYTITGGNVTADFANNSYMQEHYVGTNGNYVTFKNDDYTSYNPSFTDVTFDDMWGYNMAYVEIPLNYGKLIDDYVNGDTSSISAFVVLSDGNTQYTKGLWILGEKLNGVFNPIVVTSSKNDAYEENERHFICDPEVAQIDKPYIYYPKEWEGYGKATISTAGNYTHLLLATGNSTYIIQTVSSGTNSAAFRNMDIPLNYGSLLRRINCARFYSTEPNYGNVPRWPASKIENRATGWTLADGITTSYNMNLLYDGTTLKKNGSNQLYADLSGKQDTLVSGTSIKTINNTSLLGSGDITITPGDTLPSQTGNAGKFLTTDGTDTSWATVSSGGSLPSQTGNAGKFLTTDGTDASWADVDSFPAQSGNSGKFLTTDGTDVSWANVSGSLPTQTGNSGKFLTTDGTDASWVTVTPGDTLPSQSGNSGKFLTTDGTSTSWATVSGGGSLPSQTGNAGKYLTTDGTDASWSPVITFRTWS